MAVQYPITPAPRYGDDDPMDEELYPVASSNECTGLIPSAAEDEHAIDSYGDIYDIPLPEITARPPCHKPRHNKKPSNRL